MVPTQTYFTSQEPARPDAPAAPAAPAGTAIPARPNAPAGTAIPERPSAPAGTIIPARPGKPARLPSWLSILLALALPAVLAFTPVAAQDFVRHEIQPGDSLVNIAQQYSTDVASLVELNDIANPDLIFAGQVLKIAEPEATQSEVNQPASIGNSDPAADTNPAAETRTDADTGTSAEASTGTGAGAGAGADENIVWIDHIIAPGEWLSTIAWKYNLSIDRLVQANQISDPNLIFAGQVISVPTAAPDETVQSASEQPASEEPATEQSATQPATENPATQPTIESRLEYWGTYYDIPLELFKALTWWESGWNNSLISVAGAVGIGQLMPATVDFVSNVLVGIRLDPHNPDDNIRMSARFLRYLLDETGNDRLYALGAYYQGLYSVRTNGIYLSSMQYVTGILSLQARFK